MIKLEEKLKNVMLPEKYYRKGKVCYLDPFRKKMIYVTPEEIIRQQIARYFKDVLNVPMEMILLEEHLSHYGTCSNKRADIIILKYDYEKEQRIPCAVIECKSKSVIISDNAINQVIEYSDELGCDYLFVTNGIDILAAKYDSNLDEYKKLKELPTYKDMLEGNYEIYNPIEVPKRLPFNQLEEKSFLYVGQEFGESTHKTIIPFLTNLWECILDETHKLPIKKYDIFELIRDYGNRVLTYGNAAGGKFQGVYRSFIIKIDGNNEFVSIGFSTYSTSAKPDNMRTCLNVAIDNERLTHHSLQFVVDNQIVIEKDKYHFYHSGRIGISNKGNGKTDELKQFIMEGYNKILKNNKIYLGSLTNNRNLYLDDPEVTDFIENLISYALIRDKYREFIINK